MHEFTQMDTKGRVVIPKKIREKYGFKPGENLFIRILGNEIGIAKIKILI